MVLNDLTSRDAVLAAIEEFDALGRDEFLKTYHFAQARDHFILHGGRRYDSKAIAGVAYGKQFPDRGPLEPGKFHGGDPVIRALERLGFDVRADADAALTSESKTETESRTSSDERSAWIFQANPALYDLQGALQKLTDLPWLVKQHRDAIKRGDTVYLWEGGADAGIVAIATVTGEPAMRRQNPEEGRFQSRAYEVCRRSIESLATYRTRPTNACTSNRSARASSPKKYDNSQGAPRH
jgi:hypothetical protein